MTDLELSKTSKSPEPIANMRLYGILSVAFGAIALAAPTPQGEDVANIGPCPRDCWNEAAAEAGCDPNVDDDCLCGPFFDGVTSCVSETCGIADNLSTLYFLEPACA
ncbi:hypothetical protein BU24DRAFT_489351 [Aaosphaeria arxii CBS 175.79]|uniref:CFEM domain-containing protein n=1 Tax=Aaosphaeria arxii CBS 175.79 TaxID=1450172 RepID=A0A6A5Y4E1_9PLEO|nr:uncharacterized protein BU24DRAFT_489351 [Aaosphaeria arxii CBS 175.79]KAF2019374.1 hypothetical protein BU24DRAFT_489351 [Aaosphaeria arxii CBS 175.79]